MFPGTAFGVLAATWPTRPWPAAWPGPPAARDHGHAPGPGHPLHPGDRPGVPGPGVPGHESPGHPRTGGGPGDVVPGHGDDGAHGVGQDRLFVPGQLGPEPGAPGRPAGQPGRTGRGAARLPAAAGHLRLPLVGLVALGLVFCSLVAGIRMPWRLPGVLVSVAGGDRALLRRRPPGAGGHGGPCSACPAPALRPSGAQPAVPAWPGPGSPVPAPRHPVRTAHGGGRHQRDRERAGGGGRLPHPRHPAGGGPGDDPGGPVRRRRPDHALHRAFRVQAHGRPARVRPAHGPLHRPGGRARLRRRSSWS